MLPPPGSHKAEICRRSVPTGNSSNNRQSLLYPNPFSPFLGKIINNDDDAFPHLFSNMTAFDRGLPLIEAAIGAPKDTLTYPARCIHTCSLA